MKGITFIAQSAYFDGQNKTFSVLRLGTRTVPTPKPETINHFVILGTIRAENPFETGPRKVDLAIMGQDGESIAKHGVEKAAINKDSDCFFMWPMPESLKPGTYMINLFVESILIDSTKFEVSAS